ncbi:LacI family DNA-binding transcriptional regulator [Croceicoccus gelatinilyticus]|uniref:LacI family DNA-binding transcriptional regulator n=1 Tax=Croceicoccus gelatinilyticus TaxID=2835536 RepID=UPI001BD1B039|nr:LacI family DNA-binding transcriptional regulator [Croceicoccus gelatinilyticus]MBS7670846.1 LacI family DNA-binding transcriptional regulator [Croceicoccus gelatinilyticus]
MERPDTPSGKKESVKIRTLADLAKLAGVSTGTVSRALAGSELVKTKTREQIQALAREHGFRPNQMASKLRTQRTGIIGVVIPLGHELKQHISDPFFMKLIGHLADELTECGYDLLLSRAIPSETPDWLDRICWSGMVDGVIVIGQSDQFDTIEQVAKSYYKMVIWGAHRPGQNQCSIGTDNIEGGAIAARRLIAAGARKLAFFGYRTGIEIADRLSGVEQAANEAGASLLHLPCHMSDQLMEDELREHLAAHADEIDGIVTASDLIAVTAMRILTEMGRSVPGDVQIIGFDDLPLASQTSPALTSMRQDIEGGAKAMVAKLREAIDGREVEPLVMAPELVDRATTLPLS